MEQIEQKMSHAGKMVMEDLVFLIEEPLGEEGDRDSVGTLCASVHFTGHSSGTVAITTPHPIVREMACNMLGLDEEEDEVGQDQEFDALGEFANVFCGNLLKELFGTSPVFNLETPHLTAESSDHDGENPSEDHEDTYGSKQARTEEATTVRLGVDNGWVEFSFLQDVPTASA